MVEYTAKQLSDSLEIPLDRWKRHSREFIGIDSIAKRQGGVARLFTRDQSLRVYVGSIIVTHFRYSVSEARELLDDYDYVRIREIVTEVEHFGNVTISLHEIRRVFDEMVGKIKEI